MIPRHTYYINSGILWVYALLTLSAIFLFIYSGAFIALASPFACYFLLQTWANWKTAYMLLLFCIPISVQISLVNHSLSISLPDEPLSWLFLLLLMLLISARQAVIPTWWWKNPVVNIILIQFAWLIIAVVFSKVPLFSVKFLLAKTWYLCCFFVFPLWIFTEKVQFKKALLLMLAPMLATMVVILFRHSLLAFRFRSIQDAIGLLYYNHVEYSSVISMFFPLLCVTYPVMRKENKIMRSALLVLIVFFGIAIFFSYARAAILGVVFSLIVAWAIKRKSVNYIMPVFYGAVVLLLVYFIGFDKYNDLKPKYEHTNIKNSFAANIVATFKKQDMSSMERLYRWIAAVRMSKDHPIVGFGPHSFYYYYKPYALSSFKTYTSANVEHSTTHNYYLLMLTEQGWPAMLLYGILVMVVLSQAQKTYHRFTDKFYKNCTLGLAMAFAVCFVNNFFSELIETHKIGAMFYLALALLVILDHKSRTMTQTETVEQASRSIHTG